MAGGVSLGSAYFTLDASAAGLIQALSQAEQASKKSVQAISQATGVAEKDVQRFSQTYIRSEQQRANAAAAATLKIIKAHNDEADAAAKVAQSTLNLGAVFRSVGATSATLLGFGAIASSAVIARAAIVSVAEATKQAAQAQFALNALYGDASPVITAFAEKQAQAFGRSKTDAKEAAAQVATLARNYALTGDQIQKVLTISANLAAVRGIPLADAAERVQSALRGEAEAIEYLGIAVQSNALKALAKMTDAERAHFETLSDVTKAQIILNAIQDQSADLQGKGADRTKTLGGATDNLNASITDLAATIGSKFAPAVVDASNATAGLVRGIDGVVQQANIDGVLKLAGAFAVLASPLAVIAAVVHGDLAQAIVDIARITGALPQIPSQIQIGPDAGLPGAGPGPTPEQAQAARDAEARAKQAAAARRDAVKAELEAAQKANDATAESAIKALEKEKAAKERWYDEERQRITERRDAQVKAIEAARDVAVRALEDERQASKDSFDAQIKDAERAKDVRVRTAEEAKNQALAAIDAQKKANDTSREQEDRATTDRRQLADQQTEDARRQADQQREDARRKEDQRNDVEQTATLRRLDREKQARLDGIDAEITADQRRADRAIRNIEAQATRARAKSQDAIRGIEQEASAEDDRHRTAMQALDDERTARLAIVDAELQALDAQQKTEESSRRVADLQKGVAAARQAVTSATGTGTPEQIAAARGDLTGALRVGNETSIANARERLQQLAGQGAEAVQKANDDLTKALADLQDEQTKDVRDAQKDQLQARKDAISSEIDARKRAEDDASRQRKDDLAAAKQAEQDKLDDYLKKLDARKQARQDDAKAEIEDLRTRRETATRESDATIQKTRDTYGEQARLLQQRRLDEDRDRTDRLTAEDRERTERRTAEDRDRDDRRKAEDLALDAQRTAVGKAFDGEKQAAEDAYNGPNGIITKLRAASEETDRQYSRQIAAEKAAYDAEIQFAQTAYASQIAGLQSARQNEIAALDQSKEDWREWQKSVSQSIKDALAALDEFIKRGARGIPGVNLAPNANGGVGNAPYGPPAPGSGPPSSGGGGSSDYGQNPYGNSKTGQYINIAGYQVELGSVANSLAPDTTSTFDSAINNGALEKRIRDWFGQISKQAADDAVAVFNNEGRSHYIGDYGTSFGPFQLHVGGGLGDGFIRDTGLDPRDPSTIEQQIGWVANYVKRNGWNGQWHGAPDDIKNKHYLAGGWITEPVVGRGLRSGAAYSFVEDGRPEYVSPASRYGSSASLIGPAPRPGYAATGGAMSAVHPGANGGTTVHEGDVNFYGLTYEEAEARTRRRQRTQALLRGIGGVR